MIRLLTQADKQIILNYLERNEIETSFLYANIVEFGVDNKKDIRRCGDYYGYFRGGELKGIIPFYNLGSCIPHYEEEDAISLFVELMRKKNFNVLMGIRRIIKPLCDGIEGFKEIEEYNESAYFINSDFKPFTVDGISFINAKENLSDNVLNFIVNARANGFNEIVTMEDVKKSLTQRGEEEEYIIAVIDGKMVSQACVQTYTPKINQIGAVYTIEEERGKGYCKAVVSELCRRIILRGKIPTLFARKNNTPAIKAYSAIGFDYYDDYLLIKCR